MPDDQIGAGEMIDAGRTPGVVHGVGHVAHQGDVLSEFHHLTNRKGPTKDTHVEVHSTEDDIVDPAPGKEVAGLLPVMSQGITLCKFNGVDRPGPRFPDLALFALAAAAHVGIVDRQDAFEFRIGPTPGSL